MLKLLTTSACLALALPAHHSLSQQPSPSYPSDFAAQERQVRQQFLARHPLALSGAQTTFFSVVRQQGPEAEERVRFLVDFAGAMRGEVEPPPPKPVKPSYWKAQLTDQMDGIPFANAIARALGRAWNARHPPADELDLLALRNQQNFRAIVSGQGIATAEAFDAATPELRVRLLFRALRKLYEQIGSPCPYTVYLLDLSPETSPAPATDGPSASAPVLEGPHAKEIARAIARAKREAKKNPAAAAAEQPPPTDTDDQSAESNYGRFLVGQFLGRSSPEYTTFPHNTRQGNTDALMRSFLAFTGAGATALDNPADEKQLAAYLTYLGSSVERSPAGWVLRDDLGKPSPDILLIEQVFGKQARKAFQAEPEGPHKDAVRVAAIVLTTHFQIVAAGLLLG